MDWLVNLLCFIGAGGLGASLIAQFAAAWRDDRGATRRTAVAYLVFAFPFLGAQAVAFVTDLHTYAFAGTLLALFMSGLAWSTSRERRTAE